MNDSKKKIDAVKLMRDIRFKLAKEYRENPEKEKRDLRKIKNKYGIKSKEKA